MEGIVVNFGLVFRFREKEYVFLAQDGDTLYAALIIDDRQTSDLLSRSNNLESTNSARSALRRKSPIYAFVTLSTENFIGRAAHLARTDSPEHQSALQYLDIVGHLDREDVILIKNEILSSGSVVPLGLQNIVRELNIEE